jgi:hypothetical protein
VDEEHREHWCFDYDADTGAKYAQCVRRLEQTALSPVEQAVRIQARMSDKGVETTPVRARWPTSPQRAKRPSSSRHSIRWPRIGCKKWLVQQA